jgi:hypothetical protein
MGNAGYKRVGLTIGIAAALLTGSCTTLPSCAWGKCASPRTFALVPQTSERVYPLPYDPIYGAVKEHLEKRGYPLARESGDLIDTQPYAEKEFARFLGLQYRWEVQVRRMDSYNTAVTPKLFLHEEGRMPRFLSPGLWPEPYRYFYYQIEQSLRETHEELRVERTAPSS